MSNKLMRYSEETFESIKHVNEYGYEFWYARELQSVLEYTEWRNFQKLIEKAQTACENSDMDVDECFVEVNKTSPRWISIKDREPERLQRALVYSPVGNRIASGVYTEVGFITQAVMGEITHWMKIPEPPKEET